MPTLVYENYFHSFEDLFKSVGKECTIKRGTEISNDEEMQVHYIIKGVVRFSYMNENGISKITCFHTSGALFPYTLCLPQNNIHQMALDFMVMMSITDLTVIKIDPHAFFQLMMDNRQLHLVFTRYCINHNTMLHIDLLNQSSVSPMLKVCNFLYIYKNFLQDKGIKMTQTEIGETIGESRLEVARIFKKLRDANIIRTTRNDIIIVDMSKLLKLSSLEIPNL